MYPCILKKQKNKKLCYCTPMHIIEALLKKKVSLMHLVGCAHLNLLLIISVGLPRSRQHACEKDASYISCSLSLCLTNTLISVVKATWRVAFHSALLIGQSRCVLLQISAGHFSRKWWKHVVFTTKTSNSSVCYAVTKKCGK